MKRIFLGILAALFIVGCTTEEVAITPEQDMSFLEPSEQARLWEELLTKKQTEQQQAQARSRYNTNYDAFCEHYGHYTTVFVTYEGGHTDCCGPYSGLARYNAVLSVRQEYYLANQPKPWDPCPEFRIPDTPNLEYDPVADVYREVWEAYGPGPGDGGPGGREFNIDVDPDEEGGD